VQLASLGQDNIRIYGSPWQPEFYSWAFNLPKNGIELAGKWEAIPDNTDILITHGPAFETLDTVTGRPWDGLGCELLAKRIERFRPKIHVCGHIHSGYGYEFKDGTHFFNASVLDEAYEYTQKPMTFDWDKETNTINFV
jgi:Icc-related predicted phosphoesterase